MRLAYFHRQMGFSQLWIWPILVGWGSGDFYIRINRWWGLRMTKMNRTSFSIRMGIVPSHKIGKWVLAFYKN